nr:hypothetical protein CFP56_52999 [Quercus suber]
MVERQFLVAELQPCSPHSHSFSTATVQSTHVSLKFKSLLEEVPEITTTTLSHPRIFCKLELWSQASKEVQSLMGAEEKTMELTEEENTQQREPEKLIERNEREKTPATSREPRNLKKTSSTPRPSEEEDTGARRRDHAERSHPPPLITAQSDPPPIRETQTSPSRFRHRSTTTTQRRVRSTSRSEKPRAHLADFNADPPPPLNGNGFVGGEAWFAPDGGNLGLSS